MKNSIITAFEKRTLHKRKKPLPAFRPGDTVRVHYKIKEGSKAGKDKFRIQAFEGVVIKRKKGLAEASFTVRKIGANGVGVERVFPFYSPYVEKVDVVSSGIVRRSRLYYLRALSGKAARIRSRYGGRRTVVQMPGADQAVEEVTPELNPDAEKAMKAEEAAKAQTSAAAEPAVDVAGQDQAPAPDASTSAKDADDTKADKGD